MQGNGAVEHPSVPIVKLAIGAAAASNPWWVDYINQVSPLLSFVALAAGAIYICLQVAHLIKHWNVPRR
jgi:hypothetical protein